MHDLVILGSVFFEVFVPEVEWPKVGAELIVDSIHVGLGGALNTASVARGLGADVALVSPRGDGMTDRAIVAEVTRLGIRSITWHGPDDGAITLVRSTPEDRTFITAVSRAHAQCPELPRAKYVHVGGLPEAELFADRLAEARAAGAKISVSAGHDPPRLEKLAQYRGEPQWDVFFCNAAEAEALGASGPEELAGRIGKSVIMTRGAQGVKAFIDGQSYEAQAMRVEVVDPTGAGDGLAAGVLSGLALGLGPDAALELGLKAASRVLVQRGGVVEAKALADLRPCPPEPPK